jgi:hypothetical protein
MNTIVHPQIVQGWLDQLLTFQPGNDSERLGWGYGLAQFARRTGQRVLDVEDVYAQRVLAVLRGLSVPAEWVKMVQEVVAEDDADRSRMFGESLPIGLRLATE